MAKTKKSSFQDDATVWIASRGSPETRAAYVRDLRLWIDHCKKVSVDPGAPSTGTVVQFRDFLQSTRAPLTVRRVLATMSAVFVAVRSGHVNPFTERSLPRPSNTEYSRTEAISDEDVRRMLAIAAERGFTPLRDVAILWVLWSTGMRRVSLVSIRREGIIRKDGMVTAWHLVKGGKEKSSELLPQADEAVRAWLGVAPPSRWVFCTENGGPMSPQAVTKVIGTVAHAAGIHAHPHQFRSALITKALDAGLHIERVRAVVHHEDIRSTFRYDRGDRGVGVVAEVAAFRAGQEKDERKVFSKKGAKKR